MRTRSQRWNVRLMLLGALLCVTGHWEAVKAQDKPSAESSWASCSQFMLPKKTVGGATVGQEDCRFQEAGLTFQNRKLRRVDMGFSGTVEGYAAKEGMNSTYFTDGPEFVLAQFGQKQWTHGIGRYEGSQSVGMTVFYPEAGTGWNGKLFVHITGAGFCSGDAPGKLDPSNPLRDTNAYDLQMLEKGYAVAIAGLPGRVYSDRKADACSEITLDDGTKPKNMNFTDHGGIHVGFTQLVKNFLKGRLGKPPSLTYLYGHSSGARIGRLVNYKPGLNRDQEGKPVFDGFLLDDSGAGLWLPVLYQNGKDVLFTSQKDKDAFVKQVEISHQLYNNLISYRFDYEQNPQRPLPEWVTLSFIQNKRNNAKILRDKGLGSKHRMYEVRGVSHGTDLSRMMDAQIELLENWVEKNIEPTPTKSDWLELGDSENLATALPEVGCPLGAYYPYPPERGKNGVGSVAFAPFDGKSLEPVDGRGVFVDMNFNGYPDLRETVTEAWRRLGLLRRNEAFTRERYVECIKTNVARLRKEKLITEKSAAFYLDQASKTPLPKQ